MAKKYKLSITFAKLGRQGWMELEEGVIVVISQSVTQSSSHQLSKQQPMTEWMTLANITTKFKQKKEEKAAEQ